MSIQIRVDPEHDKAIERAIQSLKADLRLLDQWGAHSVELTLAIDDLEELRDRIVHAKANEALEASSRLLRVIGGARTEGRAW